MSGPMRGARPRILTAGWLAATVLAAATASLIVASPSQAAGPLRTVSGSKFIGYAANAALLCNNSATCTSGQDTNYRTLAQTEFNQVTHENSLKWEIVEPSAGNFQFAQADGVVAHAVANNQIVHGHTLLWHSQTPGYVQGLSGAAMRSALQSHINGVMGHYATNSAMRSWDVVNEVINDNSSPQLRQSFWTSNYGGNFVRDAFNFARAADPDAELCINDYSVEGSPTQAGSKANRLFQLVQTELAAGTPIDCVGLQSHFIIGQVPGNFQQNLQTWASLGVRVRISELDIRIPLPADAAELQTQANDYATVVNACKAVAACDGITIWGIDDGHSWLPNSCCPEGAPLLWTSAYAKKPAYDATANAFGPSNDTQPPTAPANLVSSNVTSSGVTLSWTASTDNVGVTGYDVLRAPGASGGTFAVVGSPTSTSFTDSGLAANSTFRYQVRAKDAAGLLSPVSNTVSVTTLPGTVGGCSITLTVQSQWGTGYVIQPSRVTNTGTTAISGWTVTVTLPAGHAITGFWNATQSISGQTVTYRGVSWNSNLAPGASGEFGFQVSRPSGNTALPTATCATP